MFNIYSRIWAAVLLLGIVVSLSSCGSDEPDYRIAYYLDINSQVDIGLIDDDSEQDISSSDPSTSPITTAVINMRGALHDAYPEPTYIGNDSGVLSALNQIYYKFQSSYAQFTTVTVCVVKLCRSHIDDEGVIQDSRVMAVYQFGLLPPGIQ